ncbi:MAG: WGR domain-containing protein [Caldilineaceae bacterium]
MPILLTRIDSATNARRFYLIAVAPTLLGDHCLIRIHGRIGVWQHTLAPIPFPTSEATHQAAHQLVQKRLKRGYQLVST